MTQKISNSVLITLIIVAGIFIFSAATMAYLNSTVYAKTVSAAGSSTIKVMPDLVSIYFNIQTKLWARQGSDLHVFQHEALNLACIPVPSLAQ